MSYESSAEFGAQGRGLRFQLRQLAFLDATGGSFAVGVGASLVGGDVVEQFGKSVDVVHRVLRHHEGHGHRNSFSVNSAPIPASTTAEFFINSSPIEVTFTVP